MEPQMIQRDEGYGPQQAPASDFELFEALYPKLRAFAAAVADLDMDPDDLLQDPLTSTLARHQLSQLDQPAAYLKRAIANTASNTRRKAGRLRSLLPKLAAEDSGFDRYPSDTSFLDALDPIDRAVLYLSDVDGMNHARIATEIGLKPAAVRKRASRARAQMRKHLEPDHPQSTGGAL